MAEFVAAGVSIVGAVGSIYSAFSAGQAQQDQAEFNAQMAKLNAEQENANATAALNRANAEAAMRDMETDAEIAATRRRNAALMGENRAMEGMLGFDGTGSSLLLAIDNAENAEMEAREIQRIGRYDASLMRYQGELNAYEHRNRANSYLMEADFAKQQARSAGVNKWLNAAFAGTGGAASGAGSGYSLLNSHNTYQKSKSAEK